MDWGVTSGVKGTTPGKDDLLELQVIGLRSSAVPGAPSPVTL